MQFFKHPVLYVSLKRVILKMSLPARTPAMYSKLIRNMPWTISKGTPIISCSKALNPNCSKLQSQHKK